MMNQEIYENQPENQAPKRPKGLTVLCVLSFITIGFSTIGLLTMLLGGKPSADQIESTVLQSQQMASGFREQGTVWLADFIEQAAELASHQQRNYWQTVGMNALTTIAGFIGVFWMLNGKRLGFHAYIIYNLLSVGGSFIITPAHMIQMPTVIMSLIFSGLFVFLYSKHLACISK